MFTPWARKVVILNNGAAVAMQGWLDGVAAVLEAWMMWQAGEGDPAAIGIDLTGFIMEMPLLSILQFQESLLPIPAEELVDSLLTAVYR